MLWGKHMDYTAKFSLDIKNIPFLLHKHFMTVSLKNIWVLLLDLETKHLKFSDHSLTLRSHVAVHLIASERVLYLE